MHWQGLEKHKKSSHTHNHTLSPLLSLSLWRAKRKGVTLVYFFLSPTCYFRTGKGVGGAVGRSGEREKGAAVAAKEGGMT